MNYLIVSLKHGTAETPVFWKADKAGYTEFPWAAGVYSEEEVKADPMYYNDGFNTVAVPLTTSGIESIGFKCSYDNTKLMEVFREQFKRFKK